MRRGEVRTHLDAQPWPASQAQGSGSRSSHQPTIENAPSPELHVRRKLLSTAPPTAALETERWFSLPRLHTRGGVQGCQTKPRRTRCCQLTN